MMDLLKEHFDKIFYSGIAFVVLVLGGFTFFPKRMRRTVNYLLNTLHEFKEAKTSDPNVKIEVPDFETKQLPKVPDPRTSGEKKP